MVDMPATQPSLRWTTWPARHEPVRSGIAAGLIALVVLSVSLVDGWLALIAVLVLVWATSEVLLPVSYVLDDEGVTVVRGFVVRRHRWDRFAEARPHRGGVLLVGRGHRRELAEGRTLLVRVRRRQAELIEALGRWLEARE